MTTLRRTISIIVYTFLDLSSLTLRDNLQFQVDKISICIQTINGIEIQHIAELSSENGKRFSIRNYHVSTYRHL